MFISRGRGKSSILPAWMTDPVLAQEAQSSVAKQHEKKATPGSSAVAKSSRFDQKPKELHSQPEPGNVSGRSRSHSSGMRTSPSVGSDVGKERHAASPKGFSQRNASGSPQEVIVTSQTSSESHSKKSHPVIPAEKKRDTSQSWKRDHVTHPPPYEATPKTPRRHKSSPNTETSPRAASCPTSVSSEREFPKRRRRSKKRSYRVCGHLHNISASPIDEEPPFVPHPSSDRLSLSRHERRKRNSTASYSRSPASRAHSPERYSAHGMHSKSSQTLTIHHDILDRLLDIRNTSSMSKRARSLDSFVKHVNQQCFVFEDAKGYRRSWSSYEKHYLLNEETRHHTVKVACRVHIQASENTSYILQTEWTSDESYTSRSRTSYAHVAFYECNEKKLTRYFLFDDRGNISSPKSPPMTLASWREQKPWNSIVKYIVKKGFSPQSPCSLQDSRHREERIENSVLQPQ